MATNFIIIGCLKDIAGWFQITAIKQISQRSESNDFFIFPSLYERYAYIIL